MLDIINPSLYEKLQSCKNSKVKDIEKELRVAKQKENKKDKNKKQAKIISNISEAELKENSLSLGDFLFEITKIKGKKVALLPLEHFSLAVLQEKDKEKLNACGNLKGKIITRDKGVLLEGEKLSLMINIIKNLEISPIAEKKWNRKMNANINNPIEKEQIIDSLDWILRTAIAKQKNKEYGFITLFTDSKGNYWYKVSRGFSTALAESHASLETLIEENIDFTEEDKNKINESLRKVNKFYN
jgi:hypothetical protein